MRFTLLAAIVALAVAASADTADDYVQSEGPIAKDGMLANIGPDGSKASGAKVSSATALPDSIPPVMDAESADNYLYWQAGIVIASPSSQDPDYLYTWTRDSSLVFKALIDQFTTGEDDSLRTLIDQFTSAEARLQQVSNPSGTVSTGGLGEPKFNIDESAFTGSWGRPQRGMP